MSLDFLLEHASVGWLFVEGRDFVVGTGVVTSVVGAEMKFCKNRVNLSKLSKSLPFSCVHRGSRRTEVPGAASPLPIQ